MATNLLFRSSQPATYLPIRLGWSLLPKRRYSSILAKNVVRKNTLGTMRLQGVFLYRWVRAVVTAAFGNTLSRRHISCLSNLQLNQQRCVFQIRNPKFIIIYKFIHHYVFSKHLRSFSILAAIHLFISSHNEIEDFCSMDKKTGRRYGRRKKFILRHRSYTCILLYFRRWDVTAPLHILSYHT